MKISYLVAGCLPPVALLHTLTRLAGEQFGFSDAVVEIFHCATMTAVRSHVDAEVTSSLQRSTVRIEVHVTEFPQGASSYIKAEDAGIDATIGVNDIHEAGVILVEDILSQLRDRAHQGAVHKPRTSRVQTCDPPNLL